MIKTYFIKASWQDPKQPLVRVPANTKMELDLASADTWDICSEVKQHLMARYEDVNQFTVDFMIECGE